MYGRALVAVAVSYSALHHLGLVPQGFGVGPSHTRWADWLDLLLPWLVLGPAAFTLYAAPARKRAWVLFGIGAVAYTSGHGIHLAANSVANASPGPTAHLWDEVVGHYIWYVGVAFVLAAVADTMTGRAKTTWPGYALAVAVGLTWATNAIGGGTEIFSLFVASAVVAFSWRHRHSLAAVLGLGFVPAAVLLVISITTSIG